MSQVPNEHEDSELTLPTTAYALLGLLAFGEELSGYELKQWADSTLRFYWVSPAMSHVYSELARLERQGLIDGRDDPKPGRRTARRYRINDAGLASLRAWLTDSEPEFPVLKHPVALRLLLGHLVGAEAMQRMLEGYVDQLAGRAEELQAVLDRISDSPDFRYPRLVARWGLHYYEAERQAVQTIIDDLGA